jgi:hypothetical protein
MFDLSDTGLYPDVSCLFSEFLNINAFTCKKILNFCLSLYTLFFL